VVFLRRVQILGAVRNPGLYPLDPTLTVGDALAVAGGTTPDGNPDRLELRRGNVRLPLQINPRTRVADSPIRSGDQLYVPERRWSARNAGILATVIAAGVSLAIALFTR
jgi:protein involved in polysaccharide export with SLBB domain